MPAYKDEQRGTWYVRFRYTDWTGKRHETTKRGFAKKGEAKEYEEEFRRTIGKSPDMTMNNLCTLYLDDLKTRRKPTTVYSETRMIDRYIKPYLGDMPVNQITVAVVRQWQNEIIQTKNMFTGKPLSQHTHRNISVCLSSVLNYAVRFHGLPNNPVNIARGIGKTKTSIDFWEREEFDKFLSVVDDECDRLCFSVLFTSGMRLGEMLALTPADLNFEKDTISITKTYNWRLKYTSSPKTETSVRTIAMPHSIMQAMKDYLGKFYEPPDRVFMATSQKVLTTRLAKYANAAGVKRIRLHDLRHSHASYLIHSGVPITAIANRLGHKNAKITLEVYSHVYQAADAAIAEKIQNLLECGQSEVKKE